MLPPMRALLPRCIGLLSLALALDLAAENSVYFPPRGEWATRAPLELGFHAEGLQTAVDHALASENPATRDTATDLKATFGSREPNFELLGPTQPRGGPTGLIIHRGYVVATWGELDRVDMTHSISKTFLSTVVGLAVDRAIIHSVQDRVAPYLPPSDLFGDPHNAPITWDHLLRQTSDWSGELWGVPDWADRPIGDTLAAMQNREMHTPGTHYKYNDVRVNLLALCALHVWREPLPQVLRHEIMDPIGASTTWRWHGYENSWIELDGQRLQSVSGGGHFGGGMFINAWDLARFGYLYLRDGNWEGHQLISPDWIAAARTPGPANPSYGYCNWFLNPDQKAIPSAPASAVTFRGNGQNIIYLDWEHDLVMVVRWIKGGDAFDTFVRHVLAALPEP